MVHDKGVLFRSYARRSLRVAEEASYTDVATVYKKLGAVLQAKARERLAEEGAKKNLVLAGVQLPPEMLMKILSYVPPETLYEARLVCKALYSIVRDPRVWIRLPDAVFAPGGQLHRPIMADGLSFLSRCPHLQQLDLSFLTRMLFWEDISTARAGMEFIRLLAKTHPKLSGFTMQTLVLPRGIVLLHVLMLSFPVRHLSTNLLPFKLESLTHLRVNLQEFTNDVTSRLLTWRSDTLRLIALHGRFFTFHNDIFSNCPNLEEFSADEGIVFAPLVSAKLKRLWVKRLSCGSSDVLVGLTALERLRIQKIQGLRVSNDSVSEIIIDDLPVGTRLTKIKKFYHHHGKADVAIRSETIKEMRMKGFGWLKDSSVPNLTTLTIDWGKTEGGWGDILCGLGKLAEFKDISHVQHLNLRISEGDAPMRKLKGVVQKLLVAMTSLVSLRLTGQMLPLGYKKLRSSLRELTLEGNLSRHVRYDNEAKQQFHELQVLRVPASVFMKEDEREGKYSTRYADELAKCKVNGTRADFKVELRSSGGETGYYCLPPRQLYDRPDDDLTFAT